MRTSTATGGPRAPGTDPGPSTPYPPGPGPRGTSLSLRAAATAAATTVVSRDPPRSPPSAAPPAPDDPRARMTPDGNGTYIHDRPGFTGHVDRDGKVRFVDKPSLQAGIRIPSARRIAKTVEAWSEDPQNGPTIGIADFLPLPTVKFDLTDWLMRRHGMDPYNYEKNEFMKRTRARREEMAKVARAEVMRDALHDLPKVLAAIWAYDAWSPSQRRQALFLLWDECDATPSGRAARATVVSFIRKRRITYPDTELATLNDQRTSAQAFAPHTNATPRE